MRILFATHRRYVPDQHGGAQNSAHALLTGAVVRGHQVEAAAALPDGARLLVDGALHRLSGRRWLGLVDHRNGYVTRRCASWHLPELVRRSVERFRPDVFVTDHISLLGAVPGDLPALLRAVDTEFLQSGHSIPSPQSTLVFGNSRATSARVEAALAVSCPTLYPPVDLSSFRTERPAPRFITFINPVAVKGLPLALAVAAALPHRSFLFVEGWPLGAERLGELELALRDLPNVELRRWSDDMRTVYRDTLLLLVPSQWEEAFGRVVIEAQVSGIPVVASRIGGLPESVGAGGSLVEPSAPAAEWAEAIESIIGNAEAYAAMSRLAEENVRRPEVDPRHIVDRFLEMAADHVARCGGLGAGGGVAGLPNRFRASRE